MFESIIYYTMLGIPLIVYMGFTSLTLLLVTAGVSTLNRMGKAWIPFKWHPRLAKVTIVIALIHGAMGILSYL